MKTRSGRSWRRKWVFVLGLVLLGGGISLALLHVPGARRFVLTSLQSRLRESQGIVLEAEDLDYNLLVPWFQLDQVSIRFLGKAGRPPILKAERVFVRLGYWDLISSSGTAEQISVDGLALQWAIDKEGRDNLPEGKPKSAGAGLSAFPVRHLEISNVTLALTNEPANFRVRLPQGNIRSPLNLIHGRTTLGTGFFDVTISTIRVI